MNIHLWKKELGGKNNSLHILKTKKNMAKLVSIILLLYIMIYYAHKILLTFITIVVTVDISSWYIEMICHFISFVFVILLIHSNEDENDKNDPFTS